VWTLEAETAHGGRLLPNATIFDEPEVPPRLLEFAASQPQILRCPNCRAVVVQDAEGIHFFIAATEPPRLFVDRADRDALGGFSLQDPRTRAEAADQHLILQPSLTVLVYDDTGWFAQAHVESWVDGNNDVGPQRLVARIVEQ
jgi:hypothetical protein